LCIIHNFIPHLNKFFSKKIFNEKALVSPWLSEKIEAHPSKEPGGIEGRLAEIRLFFERRGYKIHITPKGTVAEKGKYSRLLPFLFHFSILIIIIGALVGALFGFVGTVNIHVKNETNEYFNWTELKTDKMDFVMRVDDFYLEYYPVPVTIAVKDKRSIGRVTLYEAADRVLIDIKGSPYKIFLIDSALDQRFTKSSFFFRLLKNGEILGDFYDDQEIPGFPYELYYPVQLRVGVRAKGSHLDSYIYQISEGEAFAIKDTPYKVLVNAVTMSDTQPAAFNFTLYENERALGDFYNNRTIPRFPYDLALLAIKPPQMPPRIPKTMKAKLQIKKDGLIKAEGDVEVNHPMTYEGIKFYETNYDRDMYGFMHIGFQIVKDPGVGIVYSGFLLMFMSVILIFFISHKKIYITDDGNSIFLTGEATKNKKGFKEEFFSHVDELRKYGN
jgi:cytochrome c biogenesis protein ResB